jgi:hypothetical protein
MRTWCRILLGLIGDLLIAAVILAVILLVLTAIAYA